MFKTKKTAPRTEFRRVYEANYCYFILQKRLESLIQ
jgi:hypothetical protein